jgi:uncharacterized protein YvpB
MSNLIVKILRSGFIKASTASSQSLPETDKLAVKAGDAFMVSQIEPQGAYFKMFLIRPDHGRTDWLVFGQMAAVYQDGAMVYPVAVPAWPVPYFNQLANVRNPYGTCNVSSMAMAMSYCGAKQRTSERFPDELNNYCEDNELDRHVPYDLAKIAKAYGIADRFTEHATIQQVKEWLIQGNAIVIHGWFTNEGHVLCLIGFDDTGFCVHDPYGEWGSGGYDINDDDNFTKGKGLHYSYEMIERTCVEADGAWVHFLERKAN